MTFKLKSVALALVMTSALTMTAVQAAEGDPTTQKKSKIVILEDNYTSLKPQYDALNKSYSELQQKYDELQQKYNQLETTKSQEIKKLNQDYIELKNLNKDRSTFLDKARKTIAGHEDQIIALTTKNKQLADEKDALVKELSAKIEQLTSENVALKKIKDELVDKNTQPEIDQLKKENDTLKKENETLKNQNPINNQSVKEDESKKLP